MGNPTNAVVQLLVTVALVIGVLLVFARVRSDYRALGRLSPLSTFLQIAILCLYAISSYVFLDSRLAHINTATPLLAIAILLIAVGLVSVLVAMPSLGWGVSFGQDVKGLRTSGLYRYSRNPQLVGGFLQVVGYALLWPSWAGTLWAALYLVIGYIMVRTEEEHLERVYGEEYRKYCERTPRYIGLPKR